jgi:DNA-binding IclR family transcriptional regulator
MPAQHRVPVIDRMMDVLSRLENAQDRPTVRELAAACGVPRTTVYRILNTLEAHHLVVRSAADGGYALGPRLVALAARVPQAGAWLGLAGALQPVLDRLAVETGETVKLSVLDGGEALCVAVAQGPAPLALRAKPGTRYPLHAGAASKVLMAAMPAAARNATIALGLTRYCPRTITDERTLKAELARVRRLGWAEDVGEHSASVRAVAAPVRHPSGAVLAAISIAFLADRDPAARESYRKAVCRAAGGITGPG